MYNGNFKIGQPVLALSTKDESNSQKRIRGMRYIVEDVKYCRHCGKQFINLGQSTTAKSCICSCNVDNDTQGLKWTTKDDFIPITNEWLKKLEQLEEYELCASMRDYLVEINY